MKKGDLFVVLRIFIGWTLLWAFFDKLFGLGFTTTSENSWLLGVSPTLGFLANATKGPFMGIFHSIAGNVVVDWLFMAGLLFIGAALILGVARKLSCYAGILLMTFMWLAVLPPEHNPIIDEHIIYILVLAILSQTKTRFSLENWWVKLKLVKNFKFLK